MKYDEIGECYVADADDPLEGWTVLARQPFKDGVERVHVRCVAVVPAQFRVVYQRTANARPHAEASADSVQADVGSLNQEVKHG